MTNTTINIDYIRGLVETDGCFMLSFTKTKQVKPIFKFSQKTNKNLIPLLGTFLEKHNILYKLKNSADNERTRGRAPELIISGINQLRTFVNLLEKSNPIPLTGVKLRDYLIIQEVIRIDRKEKLSLAVLIGLRKSLHKNHRDDPDRETGMAKSRKELEKKFNIPSNESVNKSRQLLEEIDKRYENFTNSLLEQMELGELKVSPAYICGLIDGDGGIGLGFRERTFQTVGQNKRPYLEWEAGCSLTMEINSFLTLKVFAYALKSKRWKTLKKPDGSSARFQFVDKQTWTNFMEIHEQFPLIGEFRSRQYSLITKYFDLKKNNQLRSWTAVSQLIREIYRITARKGRARSISNVDEALKFVAKFFIK